MVDITDNKNNSSTLLKTTWVSLSFNVLLSVVKWLAGFFGNSYALIADAIESTTDVFASLLVLFGLQYSNRPPDKNHPYGHGRAEPLVTFLVVLFLFASAIWIAHDSWYNIRTPHAMPKPFTLWVLAGIIAYKELLYRWLSYRAKRLHSTILKAEAWHHRADAITSLAAFFGIAFALYLGPGYEAADDWAALFASGLIIYNCYKIIRPALGEVMDEHTYDEVVDRIREGAMKITGVRITEKCFVRKSGNRYYIDLHVQVDPHISVVEGHRIAHEVQDFLLQNNPEFAQILIHIEPFVEELKV
ncbi:MAG: hypothetical protein RLZZ262_1210 [Bacteroidota bacterium]|jgi:cation diffusion facilitator family transporter